MLRQLRTLHNCVKLCGTLCGSRGNGSDMRASGEGGGRHRWSACQARATWISRMIVPSERSERRINAAVGHDVPFITRGFSLNDRGVGGRDGVPGGGS